MAFVPPFVFICHDLLHLDEPQLFKSKETLFLSSVSVRFIDFKAQCVFRLPPLSSGQFLTYSLLLLASRYYISCFIVHYLRFLAWSEISLENSAYQVQGQNFASDLEAQKSGSKYYAPHLRTKKELSPCVKRILVGSKMLYYFHLCSQPNGNSCFKNQKSRLCPNFSLGTEAHLQMKKFTNSEEDLFSESSLIVRIYFLLYFRYCLSQMIRQRRRSMLNYLFHLQSSVRIHYLSILSLTELDRADE